MNEKISTWMKTCAFLTRRCNLRCRGCNVINHTSAYELTTSEWKKAFDIMKDYGVGFIVLFGGEPTLRHDLPELITHLNSINMPHTIITNSYKLTNTLTLHNILRANPYSISVSINHPKTNHPSGEFYDEVKTDYGWQLLDYIQKYPTCPAFCSDNCIFSKWDPPILEISKWIDSHEFRFFNPENIYKLFSKTHCWIRGHVFFAKTDVYFKYTPFDMNLRMIADWWVIHQLAFNEGIGYIPHALCAQRMHPASYGAAPSLEKRRDSWLYLLQLLEKNPRQYKRLYQSGIFRIFGLRAIYKDLLLTPRYWKYLLPICRKILLMDKVQYKSQFLRRK